MLSYCHSFLFKIVSIKSSTFPLITSLWTSLTFAYYAANYKVFLMLAGNAKLQAWVIKSKMILISSWQLHLLSLISLLMIFTVRHSFSGLVVYFYTRRLVILICFCRVAYCDSSAVLSIKEIKRSILRSMHSAGIMFSIKSIANWAVMPWVYLLRPI